MTNIPLLEAVMQNIIDKPELHNQRWYFTDSDCGTAMCAAGWACHLSGLEQVHALGPGKFGAYVWMNGEPTHASHAGRDLLDLTDHDADNLFKGGNTRAMLELMVKDLMNGEQLRLNTDYRDGAHG